MALEGLFGTVMITGCSGHVGAAVATAFAPFVETVLAPARTGSALPALPNLLRLDLPRGLPDVPATIAAHRPELVIHCAAYGVRPTDRDVATMFSINTTGAIDICVAAAEYSRAFMLAGSVAEYDSARAEPPYDEYAPLETRKIYGTSKAAGSMGCLAAAGALGLPALVLRLFNVYGPNEAAHRLLPSLVDRLARGERVPLSSGDQLRDFVYIKDIAAAFVAGASYLASRGGAEAVNVCTGRPLSVRSFAAGVAERFGLPVSLLGFGDLPLRADDVPVQYGSPDKARELLGWSPSWTFEAALDDVFEHRNAA